jgi:hypothetical protein
VIDQINFEEQVDLDFLRARRRAFLRRLMARLRGEPRRDSLQSFDEVRRATGAENRRDRGGGLVEVSKIVGSVGRPGEFDADFMPTKASAAKWKRVDRAFRRGVDLPPVSLYRIGDHYFAHDGNHRVSVARYHGVEWVDAEVAEFAPRRASSPRKASPPAGGPGASPSASPAT